MIKTKYLGIIALTSTTFLFSGCVQQPDTFSNQNRYYNNVPRVNISLVSYAYPYYFDRPYYFLDGLYYYGGYYRDGFYHYGHRHFRHGHYYAHGNRYYNGRRYRARNGVHGYYRNRGYYKRSNTYKTKRKRTDRGRLYNRTSYIGKRPHTARTRDTYPRRSHIGARRTIQQTRGRGRPAR